MLRMSVDKVIEEVKNEALVLKPYPSQEKVVQHLNVKLPKVKLMALAIASAYPVHRSYF